MVITTAITEIKDVKIWSLVKMMTNTDYRCSGLA